MNYDAFREAGGNFIDAANENITVTFHPKAGE